MGLRQPLVAAVAIVGIAGCALDPPRTPRSRREPPLAIGDAAEGPSDLVAAHNRLRVRRGLAPLAECSELTAAATRHARDMAAHRRMRHRGSDGTSPFQRMAQAGYAFRAAGENVAYGQPTVEAVVDDWWHSPGHRSNV